MDEKIIVKGQLKNSSLLCALLPIIGIVFTLVYDIIVLINDFSRFRSKYSDHQFSNSLNYAFGFNNGANMIFYPLIFVLIIIAFIIYIRMLKVEITVTDKRVYGKTATGKRVDLPLDSISSVGTSIFSGLTVRTSSGGIKFVMLKNRDELHETISKLLIERQEKEKPAVTTTIRQEIPRSNADELKKYKELFDSGIITQEEFNAKKKQLLGL